MNILSSEWPVDLVVTHEYMHTLQGSKGIYKDTSLCTSSTLSHFAETSSDMYRAMEATSATQEATPTFARLLDGATKEDKILIQTLLSDPHIRRFGEYLNTDVLWNSDAFIAKTGFANKSISIRNARARNLIYCDLPMKKAIGLQKIDGREIVNYIPAGTPFDAKSRAHVRYMGTWEVLEWISGATTNKGEHVRKALLWFFYLSDKKNLNTKV